MAKRTKHVGGAMRHQQWPLPPDDEVDAEGRMSKERHDWIWAKITGYFKASNAYFADRAPKPFAGDFETIAQKFLPASQEELRAVEPLSPPWYAVQIILDIDLARQAIAAGDARLAADIGLRLGAMAQEADLRSKWEPTVEPAIATRQAQQDAARATAEARRQQRPDAQWCELAAGYRTSRPDLSISAIARLIDRDRWHSVRRVIGKKIGRATKKPEQ
jgi:hypothetical protein